MGMQLWNMLKSTPAWFVAPSLALVAAIGATIAGYTPLVFDPSLYQAESALANELKQLDADEMEGEGATNVGGEGATGIMRDGTWTGYAACGEGNPDGWSPYYVAVTIEVKGGKVAGIVDIAGSATGNEGSAVLDWDPDENQRYLDQAVSGHGGSGVKAQMDSQIAASGSVSGVDTVSGATYSSVAIYQAFVDATKKASGEAGAVSGAAEAGDGGSSRKVKGASASSALADGNWTGYAACGAGNDGAWSPYYVAVTVKVKGGKPRGITKVGGSATGDAAGAALSWDASQNQKYLSWAADGKDGALGVKTQINRQLKASGSVSGIDTVSGATYSSESILAAYQDALARSAKAAGSKSPKSSISTSSKKATSDAGSKTVAIDSGDAPSGVLADGIWTGHAVCGQGNEDDWEPYYVSVSVEVSGGAVARIVSVAGSASGDAGMAELSWNASENQAYLTWATTGRTRGGVAYEGVVPQIESALPTSSGLGAIDVVSGATYSSEAIVKAYYAALAKSAAAAGSSSAVPADEAGDATDTPDGPGEPGGTEHGSDESEGAKDDPVPGEDSGSESGDGIEDEPASEPAAPMADGVYEGFGWCEDPAYEDGWDPYYVIVSLKVEHGVISEIVSVAGDASGVVDPSCVYETYNAPYLNRAISGTKKIPGIVDQLSKKLAAGSSASGVDVVSGATFSSRAVIDGFIDSAKKAEATS